MDWALGVILGVNVVHSGAMMVYGEHDTVDYQASEDNFETQRWEISSS
jgi:hypothetical protein